MNTTPVAARDRILRATLRLIGEQGIGAVTNRAVAKAAGVSLGSLTYHFPSQADLLRESLRAFVEDDIARIAGHVERLRATGISLDQVAEEVEKAIVEFAYGPEQIANLELHLHAARDPEVADASARSIAAYDRLAAAVLTALGIPDAERHAPAVVAMLFGLAVRRLATGDDSASGTADAFRLLLHGALPRER
ncbi:MULTISPECIES: TetR/AcrR family transcriptional regulator [Thermomonospora]|uniref:Transcriptional regulator, TetR family n=1 Tax=Thermomonospora curvata (strain ATCC 19995 / DSM 43183 / JCM 3096 / KCTC 9072 / NBRC 15933 / NCIMB 10081 / Henssen B9) TaxID=471852 RepID=D1AAI4_THECD|nr:MULTISPECIES: TetR/AcrR family transcriptional regulator [Thermomonospora]ACY98897.1 transcriptional regulator, TetR family [Thermomonospora curvata DSM 43183]PKK13098.1 MAG: TetR/AcrR family transcriptional regulator [Thermomonospora sp. CIF 1]